MRIKFEWIIILILLGIIFIMRACSGCKKTPGETVINKTDTTYIHDTTTIPSKPILKSVYLKGKEIPITIHDVTFIDTSKQVVIDSAKILEDYLKTRYYESMDITEHGSITIKDSITQNKIKWRDIVYDLKIPVVTNTRTLFQSNRQLYAGIDLGGTANWIQFGGQLTYKTGKDQMYHLGGGYTTLNQWYFHAGTDFKIKLKK